MINYSNVSMKQMPKTQTDNYFTYQPHTYNFQTGKINQDSLDKIIQDTIPSIYQSHTYNFQTGEINQDSFDKMMQDTISLYNFQTGEINQDSLDKIIQDMNTNPNRSLRDIPQIDRPDTPEVKQHDKAKEFWMSIYDLFHPKPMSDSDYSSKMNNHDYGNWLQERTEFSNRWEAKYRENNPEYSEQIQEYEIQVREEMKKYFEYMSS